MPAPLPHPLRPALIAGRDGELARLGRAFEASGGGHRLRVPLGFVYLEPT